ncbi:MAG: NAD-dependent epimerase/dehydratase family protein [Saprospiraceae bacterium]|nr:NAD-dependent epimerase/dehydratase family protein [Saprospiraceae bacterium]
MRILVSGGSGFIGRHVVAELIRREHRPVVLTRNPLALKSLHIPQDEYDIIVGDLEHSFTDMELEGVGHMIHLAWTGLPEYKKLFHIEQNLMPQYFFIRKMVTAGIGHIVITGTCLEYGKMEGCLTSDRCPVPQLPYPIAKDALRRFLTILQAEMNFELRWLRLFYTYGEGQSPNSILSQLAKAIEAGDPVFNMSKGDQLRDYLPVHEMAKQIVDACLLLDGSGIYNCCSGEPISISELVENFVKAHNSDIHLNKGYYDYPDYEAHSFWGYPDLKNIQSFEN